MYALKVFAKIVKLRFLALIEYPGSYLAGIIAQWISYGIEVFLLYLMVSQFGALAGWLPMEVLFLYAIWLLTYALGASFTFNIANSFASMAVNGTLDEALVRPMPSMVYLLAANYNLGYISHVMLTTAVLSVSIWQMRVTWTLWQWAWLIVLLITGAVIQGSLMLLCDMPSLRMRGESPTGVFFWELRDFTKYPISIYPKSIQVVFTVILPFGFINFYPVQALLNKHDGVFGPVVIWLAPVAAIILLCVTIFSWRAILNRYESAGT